MPRLKRLGPFLALVWGVAGSFAVFDMVALRTFDRVVPDSLALPASVRDSRVCRGMSSANDVSSPEVRATAWKLGVQTGLHARAASVLLQREQAASTTEEKARLAGTRSMVESASAEVARLASALKVPRPGNFTPANLAIVDSEFEQFVEDPANQTATTLAAAYGFRSCELFKMGAYWGSWMLVRVSLPGQRNVYSPHIRHYATGTGLPESLWEPMIARTPAGATADALLTDTEALTGRVTAHLQGTP